MAEVSDTTAVLLWPARMTWVGPETITSLIEAHGTARDAMLRPTWHDDPGWPVLLPTSHLAALRAVAPDRMPPDVIEDLAAVVPSRLIEVGDPGVTFDVETDAGGPAGLRGPARSAGRPHPRMGRRRQPAVRGRSLPLIRRHATVGADRATRGESRAAGQCPTVGRAASDRPEPRRSSTPSVADPRHRDRRARDPADDQGDAKQLRRRRRLPEQDDGQAHRHHRLASAG